MHLHQRLSLFVLSLAIGLANAAPAYPEYRVTVVGPASSSAKDINKAGVVVGSYLLSPGASATRGFLNRGTGVVELSVPGGTSSDAVAINDRGQVLGNWTTAGGEQRGFIYYRGTRSDIGVIPGRRTSYTDINNAGYTTAIGSTSGPNTVRGYLRAPGGGLRDIGNLPAEEPTFTVATALNNRNRITGGSGESTFPEPLLRAFIWRRGEMRDLGDLGDVPNVGEAINDRGQITGYASLPTGPSGNRLAFLYSRGRLIDIDGRPVGNRYSEGRGINNHGHVVGYSNHLSGFVYRGRRMQSLNALIDPSLGWNILYAEAINDAGQIAATAIRGGVQYAVRLDLIRPHLLPAPMLDDEEAELAARQVSPAQAAAEARLDAEAQAREVVLQ